MVTLPSSPVRTNPRVGARAAGPPPDPITSPRAQLLELDPKYVTGAERETDETVHSVHTTTTATTVPIRELKYHVTSVNSAITVITARGSAPRHSVDSTSPPLVLRSISGQPSTDPRYARTTSCTLYQPPLRSAGVSNRQQMLSMDSPANCLESSSSVREHT